MSSSSSLVMSSSESCTKQTQASSALCRRRQKQVQASEGGDPHADSGNRKSLRAQIFAAWLVDTFGREALLAGSGAALTCAAGCVVPAALTGHSASQLPQAVTGCLLGQPFTALPKPLCLQQAKK